MNPFKHNLNIPIEVSACFLFGAFSFSNLERSYYREWLESLTQIDSVDGFINEIPSLVKIYKNNPSFVSNETKTALEEYLKTKEVTGKKGDMANSADGFIHLLFYSFFLYAKRGIFALENPNTYDEINKITSLTHLNKRVKIANTLYVAIIVSLLVKRAQNLGKPLSHKKVSEAIDYAISRVMHQYENYNFINEKLYFVRLSRQLFDMSSTVKPSKHIMSIDERMIRKHNYVIDVLETIIYLLLSKKTFNECLEFLSTNNSYQFLPALYASLYAVTFGLPKEIVNRKEIDEFLKTKSMQNLAKRYKTALFDEKFFSLVNGEKTLKRFLFSYLGYSLKNYRSNITLYNSDSKLDKLLVIYHNNC